MREGKAESGLAPDPAGGGRGGGGAGGACTPSRVAAEEFSRFGAVLGARVFVPSDPLVPPLGTRDHFIFFLAVGCARY